jgi:hypothetical protein
MVKLKTNPHFARGSRLDCPDRDVDHAMISLGLALSLALSVAKRVAAPHGLEP